jgi:ABC-type sugar transport system substrate-binding protein
MKDISRRELLRHTGIATGFGALASLPGCGTSRDVGVGRDTGDYSDEEYVWISANSNLPLFVAHDHPALKVAEQAFGVKTSIAGPDTIDIPGLIAAIEQAAARKPAGMMVVGWDPEAMIPIINQVIDQGIPVVCVDADVPKSKRLSFIGTNWYDLGVRQGEAMVKALDGRKGKVALLGLIEQAIDQQAFEGFRSIAVPAGLDCMEPLQDEGKQSKAYEVASGVLQANPELVGMAGFDSESGPGMGQAIKEAGRAGKVIATCVEAEQQHLELLRDGVLTACIGQKRGLFTYVGVQALFEVNRARLEFTQDDQQAGVVPIPVNYNTGTYTVTKDNVQYFLG